MDESTAFLKRLEDIKDVPSIPVVALKINRMLEDDNISVNAISLIIEKDAAIVSKILRLVNSPFYGFKGKIDNISRAVIVLGLNTVHNAVLAVSVMDAFSGRNRDRFHDMQEYWRHSISTAVFARHLSSRTGIDLPDRAFIAGLLHDIGKLILMEFFPDIYEQITGMMHKEEINFMDAERYVYPSNHAEVGRVLAARWHLPVILQATIGCHHSPGKMDGAETLAMIVHAADYLANNPDAQGPDVIRRLDPAVADNIKETINDINAWRQEIAEEIETACRFFLQDG
ncbi:MAG: HDOD domain-containing protein [Thermodesulfobacteriota bacterium]|nr:HDOD domain-containing protein [Thermodesulfobacteriota bacterium]